MDKRNRIRDRAARSPASFARKGLVIAASLCLLLLLSPGVRADVLHDPSGNTLWQDAVTSGGHVATSGGYTLTGAIGELSGPLSLMPTTDALFHGIPGPIWRSGPAPLVYAITRVGAERTNASSVQFTVTFTKNVTGVDATDFVLTTTGTLSGYGISAVSPDSGATRTVTVSTGTGDGTIRLDVVDDDTIQDASFVPLGDAGAGNGDFATGESYEVDRTAPHAVAITGALLGSTVAFSVTFDEEVAGFDASSDLVITPSGSVTWSTASISGGPIVYDVNVSDVAGTGTMTLAASTASDVMDLADNPLASSVTSAPVTIGVNLPVAAPPGLILMAAMLAVAGAWVVRKKKSHRQPRSEQTQDGLRVRVSAGAHE